MAHRVVPPTGNDPSARRQGNFWIISQYKDFRYLWIGNFFTVGAQWIQILTVGWLVLQLTDGNAFLTGTAVGIRTLPVLLIGPWAGVLADRVDRRKLVMVTQVYMAISAVIFALMVLATDLDVQPVTGFLQWWHAFIYMGVSGIAHSIVQPVRQTMVPNTVPLRDLGKALALNGMAHPSMRIVGPAIGGLLIATLGFNWNFFIEAGFYVTIVLIYLPMKLPYREERLATNASLLSSMKEGLAYVVKEQTILQLIVMAFIPNLVFQPVVFVLPIFTTEVLGRGADAGGMLAAAVGAGGIVAGDHDRRSGLHIPTRSNDLDGIDRRLFLHPIVRPVNLVLCIHGRFGRPGIFPVHIPGWKQHSDSDYSSRRPKRAGDEHLHAG